jgi:hypothetical protein
MSFILSNLICCACFLVMYWGWGCLFFGTRIPAAYRSAVGLASCAILANIGYTLGLSVAVVGRMLLGVALAGVIRWWLESRPAGGASRFTPGPAVIPLAVAALLLAPMALGGVQFALFQANIYDQFNYLTCAVVRVTEPYATVVGATPVEFLRNPLLSTAHIMANSRPAVVDLYASFEGVLPGHLHESHYGFLCACILGTFFAVTGWFRQFAATQLWRSQLAAAGLVLGFWGQLQLDMNAWSWTAATPLVASSLGILTSLLAGRTTAAGQAMDRPALFALALCTAGLAYVYPEVLGFFLPPVVGGLALIMVFSPGVRSLARGLVWVAMTSSILLLPQMRTMLELAFTQLFFVSVSSATVLDWMWHSIVGGSLAGVSAPMAGLRWLTGAAGLGWLPPATAAWWVAAVLALAAVAMVAWRLKRADRSDLALRFAALVVGLLGAQIIALLCLDYKWLAGKGVSYASLGLLPLLLLPLAGPRLNFAQLPAWLLLGLQLAFGLFRPWAARDRDGIHYRDSSYPAVTEITLKVDRSWNAHEVRKALVGARMVKIDVPDLWLEIYAAISVQAQGVPFFKMLPVYAYWGFGNTNYGYQTPHADFDTLVYWEYDYPTKHARLSVARRDGRVFSSGTPARITHIQTTRPIDSQNGMLAWSMVADSEVPAKSIVTVEVDYAGSFQFGLNLLAPEALRDRAFLVLHSVGNSPVEIPINGFGLQVIQGTRLPLALAAGTNRIELELRSKDVAPAAGAMLTIFNPQILPAK